MIKRFVYKITEWLRTHLADHFEDNKDENTN